MKTLLPVYSLWSAVLITAAAPVAGKLSGGFIDPFSLLLCANFAALIIFTPYIISNNLLPQLFKKENIARFSVIGLFGTTLPFLFIITALQYTTPANSAILNQSEAVYSLILAYIFLKERPSSSQIMGTLMVITGVTLILFKEHMSVRWRGDIIILLSVSMFQISHIAAKKLPKNYSPAFIASARALFSLLWGLPLMLGAVGLFHFHLLFKTSLRTFGVIFFIGALTYGIRNLLWYKAIRNMDLSKATAVLLCYPVFTYLISVLLGLDKLRAYQITGLALALSGAFFITKIIKKQKA